MKYILAHPEARRRALEAVKSAPDGFVVEVKGQNRNSEQNALLHATLSDLSKSRQWAGQWLDTETWKRLVTAAWMRATGRRVMLLPALDGQGFDALYQRTSNLTKAEMAELIDYLQAWIAEKEAA